jgi:hypothetical protein
MTWKGYGRKLSWPNLLFQDLPGGTEAKHKNSLRIAGLLAKI